ncbi:MAG TPA: DUF4389 domain-containing protein [Thermoleophilia bacterium]|nr:DUF4389 domain-containing protein [Thermoleophilia bacterium]
MQTPAPPYPPVAPPPTTTGYPLTFRVDYKEKLNRVTTGFRFLWIIPIGVIAWLLESGTISWHSSDYSYTWTAGGILFVPVVLMLLFRKKYPRWWFDWNLALSRFGMRVATYLALMRDEYPSTDEEQAVHLDFPYPDAQQLSRGLPLVKWFLAIPHYVVLIFLGIAAIVCIVISWFAIVFTGKYPRSLFDFVVGVERWSLRVSAYALLLITDRYPPFTLSE